jgi:hypothetical protein
MDTGGGSDASGVGAASGGGAPPHHTQTHTHTHTHTHTTRTQTTHHIRRPQIEECHRAWWHTTAACVYTNVRPLRPTHHHTSCAGPGFGTAQTSHPSAQQQAGPGVIIITRTVGEPYSCPAQPARQGQQRLHHVSGHHERERTRVNTSTAQCITAKVKHVFQPRGIRDFHDVPIARRDETVPSQSPRQRRLRPPQHLSDPVAQRSCRTHPPAATTSI